MPAQNDSYELGLKLKLPTHCLDAIHSTHSDPRKRLLHVVFGIPETNPSAPNLENDNRRVEESCRQPSSTGKDR